MTKFSEEDMIRHQLMEMENIVHKTQAINAELLEALEAAVAQLEADHDSEVAAEMFGGEPDPTRAMAINRHDVADMARAAIAKAKGES